MKQPLGIADDLARRVAPDAEKATAVGIVGIAADRFDLAVLDVDEHSAQRRMAIHRTHRAERGHWEGGYPRTAAAASGAGLGLQCRHRLHARVTHPERREHRQAPAER